MVKFGPSGPHGSTRQGVLVESASQESSVAYLGQISYIRSG